ncbi:MAG: phosphodiester glycosidase family protein [Burkholderiales bacterium]|nr:phosphodiester glycosidase family protein [Burkholderiales bacterium]
MNIRQILAPAILLVLCGCAAVQRDVPVSVPNPVRPATAQIAASPSASTSSPYTVERFNLPGPVAGVLVKIDLKNPRTQVAVALADDRDPDGDGPCVGQLETTSQVARKYNFDITINASFFAVASPREFAGKKISYYVGNCAWPVGWHFSGGKLHGQPKMASLRATMIVHRDKTVSLVDALDTLPADTAFAVSGNAMMLKDGRATPPAVDLLRHPRSAIGLSADARTLFILAVDGRQDAHSRGVTLAELANIFIQFGANNAINLDGGGSTSLVIKDPVSGAFAIANQPSDASTLKLPLRFERPVVDVVGIRFE